MDETHMRELVGLERQKHAIQFAAVEVAIEDKIQRYTQEMVKHTQAITQEMGKNVINVMSGALSKAVTDLKEDNLRRDIEFKLQLSLAKTELKTEIAGVRSELKADIADVKGEIQRLEEKFDNHAH
ncbi:hypothetical protein [Nonomuraea sp. SYSU D8015]|uniref:hypothetical protein n=1 Tax=Nonomuraea sp. SYSU D8015 TaxID=2593644 RepID=UPI001661856F|nr:hypothetical protein [Nonomuraea sp. SYSU D8015]